MIDLLKNIENPNVIVIDECHYAGAREYSKILDIDFHGRIGLSATPLRMWDEVGNQKLEHFFEKTVFKFPLGKAIQEGFLTPYEYYPIIVELTDEEFKEYEKLSEKLARLLSKKDISEDEKAEKVEKLLIKRARILNKAENKFVALEKILKEGYRFKYSLFYCDPFQIDKVFDILRSNNIIATKFTAEEKKEERELILKKFENGEIESIVAIKCLDEGVDVPATKYAFFLSSSTNYRQFIQRRGRILRKHPGKDKAYIYDFIAVPPKDAEINNTARQILKREFERFKDFSDYALNKYQSKMKIFDLAKKYHLLDEV